MSEPLNEPTVTTTVREILADHKQAMDTGFATINTRLNSMATKDDVKGLHDRVDKVEDRVKLIEDDGVRSEAKKELKTSFVKWSGWLIATMGALATVGYLIVAIIHG